VFYLQIGDLYARNKQYETSNNYYSLALAESLEAYSQRKEEMEKKRLEIEEEDEVENQSEEPTGRAQSILTRILNKKKNSHSNPKSTRSQDTQSVLLLKQLELSLGSLYKSLAMNNHRMIEEALRSAPPLLLNSEDNSSSSSTALVALQEKHQISFDQFQEAMKYGVYDKETRVFLSSYPVFCERLFMKSNPTEEEKISALKDNNDDEQVEEHKEDADKPHPNHPSLSPHYQLGSLKYSSRTRWLIKTLSLPTVKVRESFQAFRREQEKRDAMESEFENNDRESESADGSHRSGSFGFYQAPDPVEESLSFDSNYRQRTSDFIEEHDQRELELENEAYYEELQGAEEE
jgi:hypothetical protein